MPAWFGVVVVLGLWLLARPYAGLRHDGVLYLGQTLLHLNPTQLSGDVFFEHGSQDRFSLFARLLAFAYSRGEVAVVQVVVLALCQAALLAALWRLLAPIADPALRWLGLASVAVLSHVYGGWGLFAFAERFVTARVVAEPLALWALVALTERRWLWALLALIAAGLMHPLMAAPMAVVMWLVLLAADRRWAWAVALLVLPGVAAVAGIAPFSGLLQRYDDTWWQHVQRANGAVLLTTWRSSDWQIVVMDMLLLAVAATHLPQAGRIVCAALLDAMVLLLGVSAIGADVAHNVLLTQLQLWRVQGYAHMVALALVPMVLWRAWCRPAHGALLALALVAFIVAVNARWDAGWVFLGWVAICAWLSHHQPALSRWTHRLMIGATAVAVVGLSTAAVADTLRLILPDIDHIDAATVMLLAATTPVVAWAWAGGLFIARDRGGAAAVVAVAVALLALGVAAAHWDRRTAWTKYIEGGLARQHPWSTLIPAQAQVYWHGDLAATWVLLKRPSFVSDDQGAGSLFNRATAVEVARRRELLSALRMQFQVCALQAALNASGGPDPGCAPTTEVMRQICRAEKGPDFLVFETRRDTGQVAQWTFGEGETPSRTFYLYDCLALR